MKATIEVISQRNCYDDEKMYTVIKRLRVTFLNQSQRNLIIDESIGRAFYGIYVARDTKSLSEGKLEYHPILDWGTDHLPGELRDESPRPPFVVLAPKESFQIENDFWVEVLRHDSEGTQRTWPLRSGDHVLQLDIGSWYYPTKPEEVQKRWQSFGDLIYKPIKTEPLPFTLPLDPKIEKCN